MRHFLNPKVIHYKGYEIVVTSNYGYTVSDGIFDIVSADTLEGAKRIIDRHKKTKSKALKQIKKFGY